MIKVEIAVPPLPLCIDCGHQMCVKCGISCCKHDGCGKCKAECLYSGPQYEDWLSKTNALLESVEIRMEGIKWRPVMLATCGPVEIIPSISLGQLLEELLMSIANSPKTDCNSIAPYILNKKKDGEL